jgi:UbiD family decarboxylase
MVASRDEIATSLHSRGHLWRYLQHSAERGEPLPVAVVVGGHPLFLLACSARVAMDVDERDIAGGLFGAPLEVVRTPRFGIAVPATSDLVLEGVIDPDDRAEEGPFGEFSGYASARSTNNVIRVSTVLRRRDGLLLDVVSGSAADHLNLGRIPRESDLAHALQERFPEVTAIEYPASGTHFHCYVSLRPGVPGQARQALLALLGMDPYVKLAVAVDEDIDVRQESEVMWAVATRFQADRDLITVDRVPGSLLDPSAEGGLTSRLGIDATAPVGFSAERASLSADAVAVAHRILQGSGG